MNAELLTTKDKLIIKYNEALSSGYYYVAYFIRKNIMTINNRLEREFQQ